MLRVPSSSRALLCHCRQADGDGSHPPGFAAHTGVSRASPGWEQVSLFILTKAQLQRVMLCQEQSRAKSLLGSAMSLYAGDLRCPLTLPHRELLLAEGAEGQWGLRWDAQVSCPCLRFLHKQMGQGYTPMPPLTLCYKIMRVLFCPLNL